MKLIAKSCARCPGFIVLISNLFFKPSRDPQLYQFPDSDYGQDSWRKRRLSIQRYPSSQSEEPNNTELYFRGSSYQVYRLEFPSCFQGPLPIALATSLIEPLRRGLKRLATDSNEAVLPTGWGIVVNAWEMDGSNELSWCSYSHYCVVVWLDLSSH